MSQLETDTEPRPSKTGVKDRWSRASITGVVRESVPALAIVGLILAGAFWAVPSKSRNPLAETAVWALLVITGLAGWGSLVRLAVGARERVDVGLRMAWGAGLICFVGAVLMIPALMVRTTALILVETGLVLAIAALVLERRAVRTRVHFIARFIRRDPALSIVGFITASVVATYCLGAIADWHTNPYDDDIAYLAFAKKLSDTGTVIEPFSFRRLSAYGGQTLFVELLSVRAAPSQANTFDRCVCVLIIIFLILGFRSRGRRPSYLFVVTTVLLLVTLPSIAINTASYYSGVVFFLAIFRTLVWVGAKDENKTRTRAPWSNALPIALVSAAACTLRQNYLPVPAVVLGVSYTARVFRTKGPLRDRLTEPLLAALISFGLLMPWFVVSWQSNRTFLYPVMLGTFHAPLAMNASGWNFVREVALQASAAIDAMPLRTFGLFLLAGAFVRHVDRRGDHVDKRLPLASFGIGAILGVVALVHGLTQGDSQNFGRYAFAFLMALAIAIALIAGTARLTTKPGRLEVAAGLVLFATLTQLVMSRETLWKDYGLKFRNIEALSQTASRLPETDPPQVKVYKRLQESVPPGERLVVLVDEPYYLDFARNPIWNLDMPGYSSLPPGMPSFKGSEAVEQYLRGLGVRWFMFVLPDASRYHYRREYFLELFVHESELWRTYAPYLVDFLDAEVAIRSRHRDVYSERGIIVVDLAEPRPAEQQPKPIPIPIPPPTTPSPERGEAPKDGSPSEPPPTGKERR